MSVCLLRCITTIIYFTINSEVSLSDIIIKDDDDTPYLNYISLRDGGSTNLTVKETLEHPDTFEKTQTLSGKKLALTEEEMEKFKIWPRGVIPYYIDDFSFDKVLRDRIRFFLEETTEKTGLQFVEMPNPPNDKDTRWVFFINRRGHLGCVDYTTLNFTNKGVQRVILGYDCLGGGGGALAATVLALAGVPPQHNAPDRDEYIVIHSENIIPENNDLFLSLSNKNWPFKNYSNYDFASAGHYDFYKHTSNGKMTMSPMYKLSKTVGDAKGLSRDDIWKIKYLYEYISQKPKPDITEDCSRMFKPGKKFDSYNGSSKEYDGNYLLKKVKRPKLKRGLKAKIEKEMDFDTDLDR